MSRKVPESSAAAGTAAPGRDLVLLGQPLTPIVEESEEQEKSSTSSSQTTLKYGAEHIIKLFIPVSICMIVVVFSVRFLPFYTKFEEPLVYTPLREPVDHVPTKVLASIGNALILMFFIVAMTLFLILLYKYRCYSIIRGWLFLSSILILSIFFFIYISQVLSLLDWPVDFFSVLLLLWNFSLIGVLCIHWKGPLILQQGYLIIVSALVALLFIKNLPDWTLWVALAVLAIWDLVAVLWSKGPLKILVETAKERNEKIFPALIYSSTVVYSMAELSCTSSSSSGFSPNQPTSTKQQTSDSNLSSANSTPEPTSSKQDEQGVKLGLGDFIFYSVLVGKVSSYGDWSTTITCLTTILVGLCLTIFLLSIFKKALPALPISIALGLVMSFSTSHLIVPFTDKLAHDQVFI